MVPSGSTTMTPSMTSGTCSGSSGSSSDFTRHIPVPSGSCANVAPAVAFDMTTNIDRDAGVPKPRVSVPTMRVVACAPSRTRRPWNAESSVPTPRVPVRRPSALTTRLPGAIGNGSLSAVRRLPAVTVPVASKVTEPVAKAALLSTEAPATNPRTSHVPVRSEVEISAAAGEARQGTIRSPTATRSAAKQALPVLRRPAAESTSGGAVVFPAVPGLIAPAIRRAAEAGASGYVER